MVRLKVVPARVMPGLTIDARNGTGLTHLLADRTGYDRALRLAPRPTRVANLVTTGSSRRIRCCSRADSMLALLASSLGLPALARAGARTMLQDRDLIRRENERGGTTDWLLDKVQPVEAGGPDAAFRRRPAIEGFCSRTSVRPGERLTVFVSTDPPARYRADFYRMGYYGGKGGRHVRSVGPLDGKAQPTPERRRRRTSSSADGSRASRSTIPEDWPSGVYLGKLTELDGGHQAYVVFIVRDDRPADLIFQCSDLTWQAYNRWPAWRSLYDWKGNKWHTDRRRRRRLRPPVLASTTTACPPASTR